MSKVINEGLISGIAVCLGLIHIYILYTQLIKQYLIYVKLFNTRSKLKSLELSQVQSIISQKLFRICELCVVDFKVL